MNKEMMENSFVFNEKTLKRMPQFLVLVIILLLGLPYVGLTFGMDFSVLNHKYYTFSDTPQMASEIRGYFRQTLLQWSGFSLAAVTVLLAFTQYRLSNNKLCLVIGLSVLFSGSVEALHTLIIDGLSIRYGIKNNLDALIWTFTNSMSGLLLIIGLTLIINSKGETYLTLKSFIILISLLVLSAFTFIIYALDILHLPEMWFKRAILPRPYELITIGIYLFLVIVLYPKIYQRYPSILADCIFYIAITQIVTSMYLMTLSRVPYDSAYNIAYFLKIMDYFIPCTCLLVYYVFSYTAVIHAQKELDQQQKKFKYLAAHDPLTNLYNRREFEIILDRCIHDTEKRNASLALLLIDLDNFKVTNDTFGHAQGDELLKQFSHRLELLLNKNDLLSRVGGDEFTLIVNDIETPQTAHKLAQKILDELNSPYCINDRLLMVTVSIGISIFPDDGNNTEELLKKADLAMYKSKNSGKNTFHFYTNQLTFTQHRESEIEAHLRQALINDEFTLFYQPKYNLITKEVMGAEILLRWHSKVLGPVSPGEFIPVAEHSSLIIDLGQWVLRKACLQIMEWSDKNSNNLNFSINISPVQLANRQFLTHLDKTLKETNCPSNKLELEITEHTLMGSLDDIAPVLNSISALGIGLAIDDFGKEYSSLNRLKNLPIDTLKIDKDFIFDIHDENTKVVIVDIIIKLAKELGMHIVAEGIETVAQLKYLIAKKCHYGQGFLLSKPLPAKDFEKIAFSNKQFPSPFDF